MEQTTVIAIGKLATLAGVPVETLRTWERRYGVPAATRLPSGHRRYALSQAEQLRLCKRLIDAGHRPGEVLGLPLAELRQVLHEEASGATAGTLHPAQIVDAGTRQRVEEWVELARSLDAEGLGNAMNGDWQRYGAVAFADMLAGPFLRALGEAWAAGTITVGEEHAASERLREVCASQWRPLAAGNTDGPWVVLASLSGELHQLGLQLAAATLALSGARLVYCGADTPTAEIANIAKRKAALAVVLSVSRYGDRTATRGALVALRALLPERCTLIVGGDGAPADLEGVKRITSYSDLAAWLTAHRRDG